LKDQLKKEDVVVVVFNDHGSRYVAKLYNDQWMMERGFLEVKTFKDIVAGRGSKRLITLEPNQTVAEAVDIMKKYDIEHIPVMDGDEMIGSISEGGLFRKMLSSPDIKSEAVSKVVEPAYPIVSFDTPVEKIGSLINKEIGAVMARDESGNYHILTKYDVIQSLAK
jgi:cystathionine beta-synthase